MKTMKKGNRISSGYGCLDVAFFADLTFFRIQLAPRIPGMLGSESFFVSSFNTLSVNIPTVGQTALNFTNSDMHTHRSLGVKADILGMMLCECVPLKEHFVSQNFE